MTSEAAPTTEAQLRSRTAGVPWLLGLAPDERVLEVSDDGGERAALLTECGARVVCLRRTNQ